MTRRPPTVRATIFGAADQPIEVEGETYAGCAARFDRAWGNWLPGDDPEMKDVRRVDGEDFEPGQEAAAEEALWDAISKECDE